MGSTTTTAAPIDMAIQNLQGIDVFDYQGENQVDILNLDEQEYDLMELPEGSDSEDFVSDGEYEPAKAKPKPNLKKAQKMLGIGPKTVGPITAKVLSQVGPKAARKILKSKNAKPIKQKGKKLMMLDELDLQYLPETAEERRARIDKSNLKAQKVLGIVPKSATKPLSQKAVDLLGGAAKGKLMMLDELDLQYLPETAEERRARIDKSNLKAQKVLGIVPKSATKPLSQKAVDLLGGAAKGKLMMLDEDDLDLQYLPETAEERRARIDKSNLKAQKVLGIVPKSATKPLSQKAVDLLGGAAKKGKLMMLDEEPVEQVMLLI